MRMKNSEGQDLVITLFAHLFAHFLQILQFFPFAFFLFLSLLFTSNNLPKYISAWIVQEGLILGYQKIA